MAELVASEKPGRNSASLRVDLTAMVDLAFLLVTFFMLTTTLSKPKAMDLAMPVGDEPDPVAASRTLTLCLGSKNQAYVFRGMADKPLAEPQIVDVSGKSLRHLLLQLKQRVRQATAKNLIVVVKPSDHSQYGNLITVLDELNITGNYNYAVAALTGKETDLMKERHLD